MIFQGLSYSYKMSETIEKKLEEGTVFAPWELKRMGFEFSGMYHGPNGDPIYSKGSDEHIFVQRGENLEYFIPYAPPNFSPVIQGPGRKP